MSESIQTQGKTVEEAIAEACLQLGLRRDEVDVRITQEPKSGLLGFLGGRPAKVVVRKKPERRRGRGPNNRNEDDGAHSLGNSRGGRGRSRGGRGRGGRGRGGRDDQQSNTQQDNQNAAPEAKRDNDRNNENRGRGGRPAQGGRGRGPSRGRNNDRQDTQRQNTNQENTNQQSANQQDAPRKDTQQQGSQQQGSQRQEAPRQRGARRDAVQPDSRRGGRSKPNNEPVSTPNNESRDTARNEDRGGRDNQSRSRRGGRGRSRRNNPENTPQSNEAASAAVVNEATKRVQLDQQAPETPVTPVTPVSTPPVVESPPVVTTPVTTPPKPAAEEAPIVKKKKRGGWGGGLGARLKSKSNPSVKEKPAEPKAVASAPAAELTAPAPTPTPERAPRYEERSRRPSDEIDEVIASGISATKYAAAVTGVTEENLESVLSDMTNGVLARAGFSCEVAVTDGEYRQVKITSDDESAGLLIGRHGQTVDAVEHLIERMVSNSIDDRVRMNLDINEYRQRRQEDLVARVAEAVESVRESNKVHHMESMSARERRLVHLEAEGVEGIRTFTMSGNGGKHVVLAPDDDEENDDRHDS